ncbi:MAG: alpha-glucan family phosphorylase [Dehalococcoidia bacterium]
MIEDALSPKLPERTGKLYELANNLWWSWHPQARDLFRMLNYPLWKMGGHNPVKLLREISLDKLQAAARDPDFLRLYDSVISAFHADMSAQDTWFAINYPNLLKGPVAYFSMEFAIHKSLPIYAGGLGILAGDMCKEASDLGIPLIGVGFMYPQGYFDQRISADGWQEEIFRKLDFYEAPIIPIERRRPLASVEVNGRSLFVAAWQVRVGRVSIYLLDTDIDENEAQDRQLSARLYVSDLEQRLQQEIILGIGGVRVLRALGIKPAIWHANEGHTAFMMVERVREEVESGATFGEALPRVRATSVFTTHTPVPAGHDIFPGELVERHLDTYRELLGLDRETFLEMGQQDRNRDQDFNMTILALKMADHRSAVSRLHGKVTRKMWHGLWPEIPVDEVPISHVTNGVHVPNWLAPELGRLYEKYISPDWVERQDDAELWQRALEIPDDKLWNVRRLLKLKLTHLILERAQERWAEGETTAQQILTLGSLLDDEALTIGFVRRFSEYKRPALVFHDVERLKRIVKDRWRPVQIVFAGKSHPADSASKGLLQQVYSLAQDREFQGRIALIEDYNMHLARYLVHGVDVWLNVPRRLQEASGTSGMKASLNGVLHLSVRDGWWHEGYNGANGWAIGYDPEYSDLGPEEEDKTDADALYHLLEEEIVPLYYDRDRSGIPHGWLRMVKEAISSVVPAFGARRMMKQYVERMYTPAAQPLKDQSVVSSHRSSGASAGKSSNRSRVS